MIYDSFSSFYQNVIKPLHSSFPERKRLDGQLSGGSRDSAGKFKYNNRIWIVHTDTYFETLKIAFNAFESGMNPFFEQKTKRGLSLLLLSEFKKLQSTKFKHLYIYSW